MNINLSPAKMPSYEYLYEPSENSLKKIKSYNESYQPIKAEDSSIRSQKTLQRKWDSFWSNAIETDGSQARRHIVMVSKFKKAILSLKEHYEKNDLKKEMQHLYAQLLEEHYGEDFSEKSIDFLENLTFYTLNNLRFNIFIGCKNWNSGINDAMCRIENKEHGILTKINQSKTIREIQTHIRNWEKDNVLIKKLYKNNEYQNIRIEIQNMIGSIMKLHERDSSLSLIKTDIIERIQSIIDSLAVDLSQARNDALRKWQNSIFPTLHGNLVELIESPNLDKAETIFRDALETNKNGARLLDIDLSELETHQTDTVDFFQNAITSDELINI